MSDGSDADRYQDNDSYPYNKGTGIPCSCSGAIMMFVISGTCWLLIILVGLFVKGLL